MQLPTAGSRTAIPDSQPPPILRRIPVETVGYWYADAGAVGASAPALIGLHGYAQAAGDFLGVVRKYAPRDWAAVSAQGFHQIWDPGTKKIYFSWMTSFEKPDNIERNNRFLASITGELAREGICDPAKIFLLGFSQGSSVAYRFAHRYPDRVRGIISASADLPPDVQANLAPLRRIPVLIIYGTQDKIVPPEKSLHAAEALRSGGVPVEVLSFERGHLVASSLAPRAQDWMRRVLDGNIS